MDIELLKNIRKHLKISRKEMAERLEITLSTLNDWEYKEHRVPSGKVKLVKYVFSAYFDDGEEEFEINDEQAPKTHLEEKERSIQFLERTIRDKERILVLQEEKILRLEKEVEKIKKSANINKSD